MNEIHNPVPGFPNEKLYTWPNSTYVVILNVNMKGKHKQKVTFLYHNREHNHMREESNTL